MADDVVGKLIFQVDTDVDGAKKGLEDFQDELKDTQEEAKKTDTEVGKASEGISVKGVAIATAVGVAVMKLGQEVAKATNEIQSGQANIVNATGATGEALNGLMDSAKAVYENAGESFDEVSRAIGEVNTRLGLTGTALEETTDRFLAFSGATGQDVQQSVIGVTQAMNRWNLEADQLPLLLDKLVVAGQASGVSVANLTTNLTANASTLQAMGYSMDDAIAMMMQFERQGIDSNAVLMAMKKSFEDSATAGTDARADWESLLESITNATSQAEANSLAIEAFGGRIATDMVSALQSGSLNFDDFADAVANAEGTLEATDEASKTTADRIEELKHSVTLMLSDVGEELAPMIEELLPTVKELLDALFNALKPIIPVVGELVKQLLPPLVEVVKSVMDILLPIIENLLPPLASLLKLIGTVINAVLTILNPILTILSDLLGVGMGLVNSMLTPLLNLLTPIFQLIADAINAVLTPLVTVMQTIVGWIESIVNGIKWLFGWLGDGIKRMLGFSDAVEETEQELVSFSGAVEESATEVKDYSATATDMADALEKGADAFDKATGAVFDYSTTVEESTEATEEKTEATEENTAKTEENTEATEDNNEAQREAERLANERLKTTESLNARLLQQNIQIREQGAKELELAGDIEGAYAIRARLLDEEMARELSALERKVRANEATESDITKLKQIYANRQEQLNKQKNDAIKKQDEALKKEQERLSSEKNKNIQSYDDATAKKSKKLNEDAEEDADELADKLKQKAKDTAFNIANTLVSLSSQIAGIFSGISANLQAELDIMNKAREKDLERYRSQSDEKLAVLDKEHEEGRISDEEYAERRKQIEADLAKAVSDRTKQDASAEEELRKSINEMNEKAFIANKETAIAQAVINGANAVLKGFAELGPIGGGINAGVQAGITGAQIAVISGQKYVPSYAVGSSFIPTDQLAYVHQGEMILKKADASRLRDLGGMYGVEQMASAPLAMDTQRLSPLNINNQLSAVIEVDGTQLGIAVLKNIDNASQFVLR